jgi:hypothetical protein
MLFSLLESTSRETGMPESRRESTREAVSAWLGRLDDKTVVDTLRKLYLLAEKDARARRQGNGGIGARMAKRLNRRLRLR